MRFIKIVLGCSFLCVLVACNSGNVKTHAQKTSPAVANSAQGYAPAHLLGHKAKLTINKAETKLPRGQYIESGIAFHIYPTGNGFKTDLSSLGIPNAEGTYTYEKKASNIGHDKGFNVTFNAPYEIEYTFNTLTTGTFKENWNNGEILWEGTFVLMPIE